MERGAGYGSAVSFGFRRLIGDKGYLPAVFLPFNRSIDNRGSRPQRRPPRLAWFLSCGNLHPEKATKTVDNGTECSLNKPNRDSPKRHEEDEYDKEGRTGQDQYL